MAAVIRALVRKSLDAAPTKKGVAGIRGMFADPMSGRDHDEELYG